MARERICLPAFISFYLLAFVLTEEIYYSRLFSKKEFVGLCSKPALLRVPVACETRMGSREQFLNREMSGCSNSKRIIDSK